MKSKFNRGIALLLASALSITAVAVSTPASLGHVVAAQSISVDGDAADWGDISSRGSSDSKISDWKVAVDNDYLYLYVAQNPLGYYGESIGQTQIHFNYNLQNYNGIYNSIQFAQDWNNQGSQFVVKNAWYQNVDGSSVVFEGKGTDYNQEHAFVEIAIPRSWFPTEDFTMTYAGVPVASSDIETINGAKALGQSEAQDEQAEQENQNAQTDEATETSEDDVYNGIVIDGDFADWNTIAKTQYIDPALPESAAVWDGENVYVYLHEQGVWEGTAGTVGPKSNGMYCIETSDGTKTSFVIRKDGAYLITDRGNINLEMSYKDRQYEVQIPVSELNGINKTTSTLSVAIQGDSYGEAGSGMAYIAQGLVNLNPPFDYEDTTAGQLKKITYDYDFSDWEGYKKTVIEYSSSGKNGSDSAAALYSDGDYLFGYVDYYAAYYNDQFNQIYMTINDGVNKKWYNHDDSSRVMFTLRSVDASGNVNWNSQAVGLEEGDYEYHIFDNAHAGYNNSDKYDYGRAFVHVDKTGRAQIEYYIDIAKLVNVVNEAPYSWHIKQSDIKMYHMAYPRIGTEWVSSAGASSGPILGIVLCIMSVVLAQIYNLRRKREH
ncbi:MAG: hypothetical protein IJ655_01125 [Lachnospiraceae bacterium]|nr:hypothetical protein [Lachnospiraceae bacterium]